MPDDDASLPHSTGSPPPGRDAESVRLFLEGDEEGLRQLVTRYDRLVRYTIFRTARRYCLRDPDWLDVRANEVWSRIAEGLRRRNPPSNFAAYFTQLSRNTCLDAIRRADRRLVAGFGDHGPEEAHQAIEDASPDPASILERLDQLDALRAVISTLPVEDRLIMSEVVLIVDRRWTEAAQRLGMAESTLRSRWQQLLDRLRTGLDEKK